MVVAGIGSALAAMTVLWVISLRRHNVSLVDRAWGPVFVVVGVAYAVTAPSVTGRGVLVLVLVTVWGARLSAYLSWRDRGHGEDWRHRRLRAQWGASTWWRSLLEVFWFQALAAVAVGTPLLAALRTDHQRGLRWLDVVGVAVWAVGVGFETVGDHQLARFRRSGVEGTVLRDGLWRYTRHPNYFGDAVMWWGLGLVGLAAGPWWSLLGPAAMTVVLLRVTGVTVMEPHLRATRGDAYADYVARTSPFVPLPPR